MAAVPADGWQQVWDESYQRHYYFNVLTGESTWIDPHGPAPSLVTVPTVSTVKRLETVPGSASTPSPRSTSRGRSPTLAIDPKSPRSPRSQGSLRRSQSPGVHGRRRYIPEEPPFKPTINETSKKMVNRGDAISAMYQWNEQRRERLKKLKEEYASNEMKEVYTAKHTVKLQPVPVVWLMFGIYVEQGEGDLQERNEQWQKQRKENLQRIREQVQAEEVKEVLAKPAISSYAQKIQRPKDASELWVRAGDYYYYCVVVVVVVVVVLFNFCHKMFI